MNFLGGPEVKTLPFNAGGVGLRVEELRFLLPCGQKART